MERLHELVTKLNYFTELYEKGNPIISDEAWDKLYFELQERENRLGVYLPNSPTQKIIYQTVDYLPKVKHNHPMLSLDKTKDWNKFLQYFGNKEVIGMLKMDGLTCSLRYLNGKLVSAETRGNGMEGEDILHNATVIPTIPKKIPYKEELIVDGEIISTLANFEKFAKDYKNHRAFASGSIRLLDSKECSSRNLQFVAWNEVVGPNSTVIDSFIFLDKQGFLVTPWTSGFDWDAREFLEDQAKEASFPIDGLVGRFNDKAYGESLGNTSHHSRAAYAFKFHDETYETYLRNIEWSMGRTGQLTPVAIFEPIEIDGTMVERASLHNISVMEDLLGTMPHMGQAVNIFKANQIIPQIESATQNSKRNIENILEIPTMCPVCGGHTRIVTSNDVKTLECTNVNCIGQLINRLDFYCSKKGLDIKGLSKATLEKLINWGWLDSVEDIYQLKKHQTEWVQKPGFGVKSVQNILDAIESKRQTTLDKFICALGIPLIGPSGAKQLASIFLSWNSFIDAVESDYKFYNLEGFGAEMHSAIVNFDYSEAKELVEKYITFEKDIPVPVSNSNCLEGKNFVITGKLKNYKNRDELKTVIESFGGKVVGSVSKNTNYLINNDTESTSSKNLNAISLNIPIISEEDFRKLIEECN